MKWKVFFIIFKEVSLKQIKLSFLEGESSTLISFFWNILTFEKLCFQVGFWQAATHADIIEL